MSMMEKVGAKIPDRVYGYLAPAYWWLHPGRDYTKIKRINGVYLVTGKDYKFWVPYARDARPDKKEQFYNHGFERYYKVTKDDVVLDLGSHTGVFVYEVHNRCKHIYCVEPDTECLELNTKDMKNVTIIPKATSNKKGKATFYVGKSKTQSGLFESVTNPNKKQRTFTNTIEVDIDTLDNMFKGKQVDVIKADIEGAEIDTLLGATETLKKAKYVAIASYHILDGESTTNRVKKILEDNGFKTTVAEQPVDVTYGWKPEVKIKRYYKYEINKEIKELDSA